MKIANNLLAISMLLCCGVGALKSQSKHSQNISQQNENQIAYLFFKINKDTKGVEKISLYDKKIVKGKLKSIPTFGDREALQNDFVITLFDAQGNEIIKQSVEDPLNPEFESYGDTIERHKMSLKESEFSFRFPYSDNIKSIKIERINNSKKQVLFTQNF